MALRAQFHRRRIARRLTYSRLPKKQAAENALSREISDQSIAEARAKRSDTETV